ncbi:MAG: PIN domain-containing protein [Chloroflexi bacterium]|nr:PIN domain-containing protein [Chloroflexota bacterium]
MRVLLDTNVVLDALLKREPWANAAKLLWEANDDGRITGYLTASTLTDIFYIARKSSGNVIARDAIKLCLEAFEICAVDRSALEDAIALTGIDFEDNLQIACAAISNVEAIVTRNKDDFAESKIQVLTPDELLKKLSAK